MLYPIDFISCKQPGVGITLAYLLNLHPIFFMKPTWGVGLLLASLTQVSPSLCVILRFLDNSYDYDK